MSVNNMQKQKRIQLGENLPNEKVTLVMAGGKVEQQPLHAILVGKKTALFAVPGAFTPTCAMQHVPSFLKNWDALKQKGIDQIICLAVNDQYVLKAWQEQLQTGDKIILLADGSGHLTKKLGLDWDLADHNLGLRSERYAMLLDGIKLQQLFLEKAGEYKVSSGDYLLSQLA